MGACSTLLGVNTDFSKRARGASRTAHLAALTLLLPALLLGCKKSAAQGDTATPATTAESAATKSGENSAQEAISRAATGAQAAAQTAQAAAAKPGPVPAGYTRVPDLSVKPVLTFAKAPAMQLQDGKDYAAVIDTSEGQMVVDLYEDVPTTTNSFIWLARHKFYDGQLFHRVLDGFVVQGGDPNTLKSDRAAWGTGGPGYSIPLEVRQKYTFDAKGVLGMARSQDPNSGGSQFYITLAAAPNLDGQYTVFGKVVQGLGVLDKIKKVDPQSADYASAQPDKMQGVYIVTKNK